MPRGNGGIVGPVNTSFSGVWSLTEAQLRRSANTWPNFYAALLSESATGSDVFSGADAADPYFEYTTLLLPGNGTNGAQNNTFLDSSTNNFTITRNGNTTQGTFSPFSQTGWGNYFNGSSYLSAGTTLFNYTTGNASTTTFTIEAFVYLTSYQTPSEIYYSPCIISKGDVYFNFGVNGSGNLIFYHYDGTIRSITGSTVIPLNTWTYVAVTVTGGTATIYVNGASVGSGTWYGIQSAGQNTTSLIGRVSTNASSLYFNGYISNLRVSTVARTITTPTVAYTNDANTALLTAQSNRFVDNSSSPITLTLTGSPSVQAFSPFNPTASWSAATYGGSGYFDGNGDYLQSANSTAFNLASNNFTIELWYYTASTGNQVLISAWNTTSFEIIYYAGTLYCQANASAPRLTTTTWPLNQWNHIAYVRSGNTHSAFLNGTRFATTTDSQSIPNVNAGPTVGARQDGTFPFSGYIASARIVNGTAVYDPTSSTLTVPTAPLTNITNTSLLLNFTNAGVYDATSKNDLETVGNAQISTTQSKWGGSSMYFDGTGDYLTATTNAIPATGAFTIEMFVYIVGAGASQCLVSQYLASTSGRWAIYWNDTANKFTWACPTGQTVNSDSTYSINNWIHFVAQRDSSNVFSMYVNGTRNSTTPTESATLYTGVTYVGDRNGGGTPLNGYIQDLRITRGVARYSGSSITVPTAAFPTL